MSYRIFSIKRPRRLFQTWLCGSGVYLNGAVYLSKMFIKQGSLIIICDIRGPAFNRENTVLENALDSVDSAHRF